MLKKMKSIRIFTLETLLIISAIILILVETFNLTNNRGEDERVLFFTWLVVLVSILRYSVVTFYAVRYEKLKKFVGTIIAYCTLMPLPVLISIHFYIVTSYFSATLAAYISVPFAYFITACAWIGIMKENKEFAYCEGQFAANNGVEKYNNPYPKCHPLRGRYNNQILFDEWNNGYKDADKNL